MKKRIEELKEKLESLLWLISQADGSHDLDSIGLKPADVAYVSKSINDAYDSLSDAELFLEVDE